MRGPSPAPWPVAKITAWLTPRSVGGISAAAGAGKPGGDARDDAEGDAGLGQRQHLLAGAAEHERVAALEADDARPCRASSTRRAEIASCSAEGWWPRLPAGSIRASGPRKSEDACVDQRVVDDHVGLSRARQMAWSVR